MVRSLATARAVPPRSAIAAAALCSVRPIPIGIAPRARHRLGCARLGELQGYLELTQLTTVRLHRLLNERGGSRCCGKFGVSRALGLARVFVSYERHTL